MKRATETAILETAFEPYKSGYIFYRSRRSPGFVVTAKEREAFLASGFWERRNWVKAVALKSPTTPPRNAHEARGAVRRLRAAMPRRFIVFAFAFAALFSAMAFAQGMAVWQRLVLLTIGLFFGWGGTVNLIARLQSRRAT